MTIFLVGYMGCGKTSLARKLARTLGYAFADTDEMVERSEGASVADLFRYEGEEHFRKAERKALDELINSHKNLVVATGGGLPAWGDNMQRMNGAGHTIYIKRTPAQIAARLTPYGRQKRPRLRGLGDEELLDFMTRNMADREPFYAQAQLTVDATGLSDNELLEIIQHSAFSIQHFNNSPIGVYDSGLGGLTVWREIRRLLPNESLVYLGDGKNCPYGSKPAAEIQRLADEAVATLIKAGCKMVVVACNTATAAAIDCLREKYKTIPIVGMEPAVKPACLKTKTGTIGVLATAPSLDGDLFRRTAAQYGANIEVLTAVGEGFVELVEQNREHTPEALETVRRTLQPLLEKNADQIVLGCTHYPFLIPTIQRAIELSTINYPLSIIDPSPAVARRVEQILDQRGLRAADGNTPRCEFITFADEAYREQLQQKASSALQA